MLKEAKNQSIFLLDDSGPSLCYVAWATEVIRKQLSEKLQ